MPLSDNKLNAANKTNPGQLDIPHLKQYWSRMMSTRDGKLTGNNPEYHLDCLMIHALGLGLEQATQYVLQNAPDFAQFEAWVIDTAGPPSPSTISRLHHLVHATPQDASILELHREIINMPDVLTPEDMEFWRENGYIILHDAVPATDCAAAAQVIWSALGAQEDDVESWYHGNHNNIMVQLFQSAAFEKNRRSLRIHKAFAQLWDTPDLWVTTDRCGFNVPDRHDHRFRGPDLHWDVSLQQPIPYATQGILYLTDTPPEQGALTLVPGFHHRINAWLDQLPADANPREEDLHALGSRAIGGKAGDLIIWLQALPHGSRANLGKKPRLVQYINMVPNELLIHDGIWR